MDRDRDRPASDMREGELAYALGQSGTAYFGPAEEASRAGRLERVSLRHEQDGAGERYALDQHSTRLGDML